MKAIAPLAGLTSLAILVQAVLAGLFIDARHTGLISVHGMIANVVCVLALGTAVVAFRVRSQSRQVWLGSVALFVLVVVQTIIGHLITNGGHDSLITIHVPLAMIVFGIAVWLPVKSAPLARETPDLADV